MKKFNHFHICSCHVHVRRGTKVTYSDENMQLLDHNSTHQKIMFFQIGCSMHCSQLLQISSTCVNVILIVGLIKNLYSAIQWCVPDLS